MSVSVCLCVSGGWLGGFTKVIISSIRNSATLCFLNVLQPEISICHCQINCDTLA